MPWRRRPIVSGIGGAWSRIDYSSTGLESGHCSKDQSSHDRRSVHARLQASHILIYGPLIYGPRVPSSINVRIVDSNSCIDRRISGRKLCRM